MKLASYSGEKAPKQNCLASDKINTELTNEAQKTSGVCFLLRAYLKKKQLSPLFLFIINCIK